MIVLACFTILLLFFLSQDALGASSSVVGQSMPLRRLSPLPQELAQVAQRANRQRNILAAKYGGDQSLQKRATGYNLIVNQDGDTGYYGSIAIGTPLVAYDVILDTGSSDLWLTSSTCTACGISVGYDPAKSSTFKNLSTPFQITYGLGAAAGYMAAETFQMAGFSMQNQSLGVVDALSSEFNKNPVSGVLGLAWTPLASIGQAPFWETLASGGSWDSALFGVQLTRYGNVSHATENEPGGVINLGYTNSSLYTGSIEYHKLVGQPRYWEIDINTLTVQGTSIDIAGMSTAAIDTGTTNIAGPATAVRNIYAQIPGSQAGMGQLEGYYIYPCSTTVNVEFKFGNNSWSMSHADFTHSQVSSTDCVGAFFVSTINQGGPSWIIGDAFLKNVYSVFRYNPPSVGFAALSETAKGETSIDAPAPSPTIGAASTNIGSATTIGPLSTLLYFWLGSALTVFWGLMVL